MFFVVTEAGPPRNKGNGKFTILWPGGCALELLDSSEGIKKLSVVLA